MRRLLCAFLALAAISFSTFANAEFVTFDKGKFEALVQSKAPVVLHAHEWW